MSLKKIAERAGTSVSTVSRVLNSPEHRCNEPGLAERIWELADELHYLPNHAARDLRLGGRQEPPAFTADLFLARFDSVEKDPFFYELYLHIKEELLQQGCLFGRLLNSADISGLTGGPHTGSIPWKSTKDSHPGAKVISPSLIREKKNTGLIILGKCPHELIPLLKKRYACIVGIDRNPTEYEYDEVICNGTTAAEKAMNYLIGLGHRNIAYIGDCTYEARYIGYYQALIDHKIPFNYGNIHPTGQTKEEGFHVMTALLKAENRPSAIFCANDSTALGVLDALKQNKKRGYMPSIISIDNINDSQKTLPMLTTIDIPKKEMVHLALSLLVDRKDGGHHEYIRAELPCRLIERESCTYYRQ